MTINNFKDI